MAMPGFLKHICYIFIYFLIGYFGVWGRCRWLLMGWPVDVDSKEDQGDDQLELTKDDEEEAEEGEDDS